MARSYLIYGTHAVRALIDRSPDVVLELWVLAGSSSHDHRSVIDAASTQGIRTQRAPRATLDKMTGNATHQGVVARCRARGSQPAGDLKELLAGNLDGAMFLVLDGIEDPHNLGACLRVADAAGVRAVVQPQHRGTGLTSAAIKVASGAAESVPMITVNNLARALTEMKAAGVWLVGTAAEAEKSIFEIDLTGPVAIVVGAEGHGIRRLTREHCDYLAHLPMLGTVESLNVSVSAGICLYEALRQRQYARPRA